MHTHTHTHTHTQRTIYKKIDEANALHLGASRVDGDGEYLLSWPDFQEIPGLATGYET